MIDMERVGKIIEAAVKLKTVMQRRKITRARAPCPFCKTGFLHGVLAGPKQHIHMSCDACDVAMMQ